MKTEHKRTNNILRRLVQQLVAKTSFRELHETMKNMLLARGIRIFSSDGTSEKIDRATLPTQNR